MPRNQHEKFALAAQVPDRPSAGRCCGRYGAVLMLWLVLIASVLLAGCVPGPGEIRVAEDEATACAFEPLSSGAIISDSTDHVRHRLTGELVCPRGFSEMYIDSVVQSGDSVTFQGNRKCYRNRREIRCEDGLWVQ